MGTFDTSMGGRRDSFPETVWSSVLSDRSPDSPVRRAALDRLIQNYWRPVYSCIRRGWRKPVEESKDLTQDFFRHILEKEFVAKYDPGLGRFRHFLKGALRNYLAQVHQRDGREKRGGGRTIVSLDVDDLERQLERVDTRQATPDEAFDLQWKRDLLARSLAELERASAAEGRADVFRVYAAYTEGEGRSYDDVSRTLSIPVEQVTHHLHEARRRMREIVRGLVAEVVASSEDLDGEVRELFGA